MPAAFRELDVLVTAAKASYVAMGVDSMARLSCYGVCFEINDDFVALRASQPVSIASQPVSIASQPVSPFADRLRSRSLTHGRVQRYYTHPHRLFITRTVYLSSRLFELFTT